MSVAVIGVKNPVLVGTIAGGRLVDTFMVMGLETRESHRPRSHSLPDGVRREKNLESNLQAKSGARDMVQTAGRAHIVMNRG